MNYIETNKALWNTRTDIHVESEFYDMKSFLDGESTLKNIELPLLGDLKGKSVLHLQCHFGQDSISMARMGATVTGVDFSEKAVEKARELAGITGADAEFICTDIYDLPDHLEKEFDIVFTSYGTIGWFPDLDKWAKLISTYLKPGGKFIFAEFHPLVWMWDNDFTKIAYSYFKAEPIVEMEEGTYANTSADIGKESITWNHSIGEVLTCILSQGLEITSFEEYDYSPYDVFSKSNEVSPGKFQIQKFENKLPLVYALSALKK